MLFVWRRTALHGDTTRVYTAPSGASPVVSQARWELWTTPRLWMARSAPSGDAPPGPGNRALFRPFWRPRRR